MEKVKEIIELIEKDNEYLRLYSEEIEFYYSYQFVNKNIKDELSGFFDIDENFDVIEFLFKKDDNTFDMYNNEFNFDDTELSFENLLKHCFVLKILEKFSLEVNEKNIYLVKKYLKFYFVFVYDAISVATYFYEKELEEELFSSDDEYFEEEEDFKFSSIQDIKEQYQDELRKVEDNFFKDLERFLIYNNFNGKKIYNIEEN